ncbi:hypothetical protein [Pseudoscardovia suis]|uniref:Hemagglutinin n=1 Tax=Pseudoscardovia suis TaxID=987063 RepID=A0A261EX02_9BIFI|nr:hypothetical protein [Pseudoscardovia suis]OZG51400.1 hemagglutinin [Pseudoscardovia suis]PJJ68717.1 hypothetical protein CLV65_0620 [Pseudoscardovia suis]
MDTDARNNTAAHNNTSDATQASDAAQAESATAESAAAMNGTEVNDTAKSNTAGSDTAESDTADSANEITDAASDTTDGTEAAADAKATDDAKETDAATSDDVTDVAADTADTADTATPDAAQPAAHAPSPASHRLTSIVLLVLGVLVIIGLMADVVIARRRAAQVREYESEQALLARQYGFNPGLIIADDEMTDSTSLTTDEIQDFLDTRGAGCSGDSCLATKTFDTNDEKKDSLCDGYTKASDQTAAQIISGVATSCGINPKVLIVMLQKEQGLVTAANPTNKNYTIAMGLSCPDDGDCDAAYYGFFNQVFGAAHRLKYYQAHFKDYNYRPKQTAYIQYNPDESCGGTKVYIENDATAMLYIYTPYQPNKAALEGLADGSGGEGDSCSTYGNRNFTLFYNAWFGDPTRGEGTSNNE